jgi:hypothetical protein
MRLHSFSIMATLTLGWFTFAGAHQDPVGETLVHVGVKGGSFAIYTAEYPERDSTHPISEVLHACDGSTSSPRRKIAREELEAARSSKAKEAREAIEYYPPWKPGVEIQRSELCLGLKVDSQWTHTPLPIPEEYMVAAHLLRPDGAALVLNKILRKSSTGEEFDLQHEIAWLDRPTLHLASKVDLGNCATINMVPTMSHLIWAENRVWFAWIRKADDFEKLPPTKQWVTVLASYEPKSKKLEKKILAEQSHWNANLSLNSVAGWVCVAWHCSRDGSYPGESMIVTHFEKVSP